MVSRGDVIRLRVLGTPVLECSDGSAGAVLSQPKRLALLSYLAVRGDFVRRDELVGLFWADLEQERARRALSQAIHFLRRALGKSAIRRRGVEEIGLDKSRLWCDVTEFDAAVRAGRWESAYGLYRGELLLGVHALQAAEFGHWLDVERERLTRAAAEAASAQARECYRDGRAEEAAAWQRKALGLRPVDEGALRECLALLDEVGDGAAAIEEFDSFRARLADAVGLEPSLETIRIVELIRARRPDRAKPVVPVAPAAGAPPARLPARAVRTPRRVPRFAKARWPRRWPAGRRGRVLAFVAAVPLLFAGAWLSSLARTPVASGAVSYPPSRVAVLYLGVEGASDELRYLADGLTEALIRDLATNSALNVVSADRVRRFRGLDLPLDSVARLLQAGTIITGRVRDYQGLPRVYIERIDGSTGMIQQHSLEYPVGDDDVLGAIDGIAAAVSSEIRPGVGDAVRLDRWKNRASNGTAWRLAAAAGALENELPSHFRAGGFDAVARLTARADSLLAEAVQRDARWPEPHLLRAQFAWSMVFYCGLTPDCGEVERWFDRSLADVNAALAIDPREPAALAFRGRLAFHEWLYGLNSDPGVLAGAEEDLRAALIEDGSRAEAWSTLSSVLVANDDLDGGRAAAERALAEDAFLADRVQILSRLFEINFNLEDDVGASRWCDELRALPEARSPAAACELTLQAWSALREPDPVAARGLVEVTLARQNLALSTRERPQLHALLAAVLWRAGHRAEATSMVDHALTSSVDPETMLLAAASMARMGRLEEASRLLSDYVRADPVVKSRVLRNRWFRPLHAIGTALTTLDDVQAGRASR